MKTFSIILALLFFQDLCSQNLLEIAILDKSNIIIKKPIRIDLKTFELHELEIKEFLYYLEISKLDFDKKDTTTVRMLIEKAKVTKPDYKNWNTEELPNKILITTNEVIKVKEGLEKASWKTKADKKRIKKEIRKYNNRGTGWRSFPLLMSRPIYSTNKKYALIGFIRGNNGGNVSLFMNVDGNWTFIEYVTRWAY